MAVMNSSVNVIRRHQNQRKSAVNFTFWYVYQRSFVFVEQTKFSLSSLSSSFVFSLQRPKISHAKSLKKESCSTIPAVPDDFVITSSSSSSSNTAGHRTMIVKQSYKPLHSKCNRNTIAVTKGNSIESSLLFPRRIRHVRSVPK